MTLSYYILLPLLCAASFTDWRQRRIPNWLLLSAFILSFPVNFLLAGMSGILSSLGGAVIGFALLIVPYLFGGMGAGDVKLLTVIGSLGGVKLVLYGFLFGAVAGGILAAGMLLYNFIRHKEAKQGGSGHEEAGTLPYAIPLSVGTLLYMLLA